MTFIFEVDSNAFNLVSTGQQTFDILNLGPRVAVGDTVIYQKLPEPPTEEPDENQKDEQTSEISVSITSIFNDTDKTLKKNFTAFQFKVKE